MRRLLLAAALALGLVVPASTGVAEAASGCHLSVSTYSASATCVSGGYRVFIVYRCGLYMRVRYGQARYSYSPSSVAGVPISCGSTVRSAGIDHL